MFFWAISHLFLCIASSLDIEDILYSQISCSNLNQVQEVFKTLQSALLDEESTLHQPDTADEWPITFIDKPLEEIPQLYDYIHHFLLETDSNIGGSLKLFRGDNWNDKLGLWCRDNVVNSVEECMDVVNVLVKESTEREEWQEDTRRKQNEIKETREQCEIRKSRKTESAGSIYSQVNEMNIETMAALGVSQAQCKSKEMAKNLYSLLMIQLSLLKDYHRGHHQDDGNKETTFYRKGMKSGSDKVTHHRYDVQYSALFDEYLQDPHFRLLEIGLSTGKSMALWCDFLPLDAQVHAIDTGLHPDRCSPCPLAEDVWGWYANSSDRVAMERVTTYLHHQQVSPPASSPLDHGRKRSGFDMIIDDGGHNPRDQLAAFNFLFHNDTALRPGGVYIIEDIETSYWLEAELYGEVITAGKGTHASFVEAMKTLVDTVNGEYFNTHYVDSRLLRQSALSVQSIHFARNMIIIKKRHENSPLQRNYRYDLQEYVPSCLNRLDHLPDTCNGDREELPRFEPGQNASSV